MKLLDVVALLEDLPDSSLVRGQVGTIVEEYEPEVFEVEFSDPNGRAYAITSLLRQTLRERRGCANETLNSSQLLVLHHQGKELMMAG